MQRLVARKAVEGNISTSDTQVNRKVLDADFNGSRLDLTSDANENLCYRDCNDLPLNNRPELERMKEPDKCKDPGTVLYMESDFIENNVKGISHLTDVNKNFLNTLYTFRINVSVMRDIGNDE